VKVLLETEPSWRVTLLDDGIQQNVPDLMLTLGQVTVLIECKTTTKNPPLIKKEEAFAVLQKAIGFDPSMHRVTLGKPGFDDHSKKKVQSATDVTLVEHEVFIEGFLRVATRSVTPEEFVAWLSAPGLTELDRLGGAPSYEILRKSAKL
jgi:helicase